MEKESEAWYTKKYPMLEYIIGVDIEFALIPCEKNNEIIETLAGFRDRLPLNRNKLKCIIDKLTRAYELLTEEDIIELQKTIIEQRQINSSYRSKIKKDKEKKREGFIYILKAEGHNYYKIGKTIDVDKRIEIIIPQMPFKSILLHTILSNNIDEDEKLLHNKFQDKRTNGEWFELTKRDVRYLLRIENMETI